MDRQGRQRVNRDCDNRWEAIFARVSRYGRQVCAAVESCTGAANLTEELVAQAGWSVHLAHPGYVARMKQNPDKTDYQDARLLADLERVGYLPRVWLAPEPVRELRHLVRYRQQLAEQRRRTKQRVRALLREQRQRPPHGVRPWTKRWKTWLWEQAELSPQGRFLVGKHLEELARLAKDLREAEKRLTAVTAEDPVVT